MNTPIYSALKKNNLYPFHMPGHKRNDIFDILKELNYELDITEIEGFDNLNMPQGIIKESEQLMAKTFGAHSSFMLVNGSTHGVIAAILSQVKTGEKILIARNSHKSVYNAVVLSGAQPVYVYPPKMEFDLLGGINPNEVRNALEAQNIKSVLITSPTYYGFVSDIEAIAKAAHDKGASLIVDEALGAHFKFNECFPTPAINCGADLVVQSLHKTLPSLTQTAVLHTASSVHNENIREKISLIQTTSPSYIFLASMDLCRGILDEHGAELFESYCGILKRFRQLKFKNFNLVQHDLEKYFIKQIDITKLIYGIIGHSGSVISEKLRSGGIELEMHGLSNFLAFSTVFDTAEAFIRLETQLKKIDEALETKKAKSNYYIHIPPTQVMTPREACDSAKRIAPLKSSINKISASFITPYPPGIPLAVPGELITSDIVQAVAAYRENNISVMGLHDDCVFTVE